MLQGGPIEVDASSPFTLNNIPFGIFSTQQNPIPRPATIIGHHVLDLQWVERQGLLDDVVEDRNGANSSDDGASREGYLFSSTTLNTFASRGSQTRQMVRSKIIALLSDPESQIYSNGRPKEEAFVPAAEAQMHLPMQIGGFTDFLTSRVHAENCAKMAGGQLHPSFDHFPTAYNGRASSVVVSGHPVPRPYGMTKKPNSPKYEFTPSSRFDFELEMGIFISQPIPYSQMVTADEAAEHIFGLVLLNDWSSRDIQFAEMFPLGPFNGKGSSTSISAWVITPEALAQSQSVTSSEVALANHAGFASHLKQKLDGSTWDIDLQVEAVPGGSDVRSTVSRSNLRCGYWSPAQMLAHHASSGCGLRTGDLIGTGTLSGPGHTDEAPTLGCLHELNLAGTKPIPLPGQYKRKEMTWLEDGDEVIFSGWASGGSAGKGVGFGELRGKVVPRGSWTPAVET